MVMMAAVLMALSRPVAHAFHTGNSLGFAGRSLSYYASKPISNVVPFAMGQNKVQHDMRLFSTSTPEQLTDEEKTALESKIKDTGDKIRALKDEGADKSVIAPVVEELLALKGQLDPTFNQKKPKQKQQEKQQQQPKKQQQQQKANGDDDSNSDFITAREVDYSKWYNDLIRVTGLAENSPVRGCMVIKPWGMSLWDKVRNELDDRIKEHGAENAYFPLLIPKSFLSKEAEHVDGFAKECAVVTHHRLKSSDNEEEGLIVDPDAELEDPLIIRPTSETMIWHMFRKWIVSHRYVKDGHDGGLCL